MSSIRQLGKYELNQIRIPNGTPDLALQFFAAQDSEALAVAIVNDQLNDFIAKNDTSEGHAPLDYQGWGWRSVDFFTPGGVTIAKGDGRVAVCQNNKWDYTERDLTAEEQARFLEIVWSAYEASRKGGLLSEIISETERLLVAANDYILSLDIQEAN